MTLTALDFPSSPTVGTLYPDPPVTGQPQYRWGGTQWLASKAAVTQIARTDALGWSGMQINGSMDVSQENGTSAVVITGTHKYVLDGWHCWSSGVQVVSAFLNNTSNSGTGFVNSLQFAGSGAGNVSPAAGDYVFIQHPIEGYRVARLGWGGTGAQSITIGFWIRITRSGMYSGAVRNSASNRCYVFTFTVNAANTWEYKTVTIPGDTTGTWLKDNGVGISLFFTFMAGSSTTATPNAWSTSPNVAATGTANLVMSASDYVLLTGVVVLPGIEAPTAAQSPLIMRPYDQELVTCKRYYEINGQLAGYTNSASSGYFSWQYTQEKRATPTVGIFSASAKFIYQGAAFGNISALSFVGPDPKGVQVGMQSHIATYTAWWSAALLSGALYADARL